MRRSPRKMRCRPHAGGVYMFLIAPRLRVVETYLVSKLREERNV